MKTRKAANADAEEAAVAVTDDSTTVPLLLASTKPAAEVRGPGERPRLGEEHTIAEALCALDFWLLFSSFLMGVGTGLAVMNNLGQMGVAMGYSDVSLFVSMTSIWGFFGRIASGTISEHFIKYVTTTIPHDCSTRLIPLDFLPVLVSTSVVRIWCRILRSESNPHHKKLKTKDNA
jgi:hypothetical protein